MGTSESSTLILNVKPTEMIVHGRLFKLYDQMIGEIDLEHVLHHTSRVVREALNAERATIYLVRESTQELESAAIIGNVSRTIRIPIRANSLAGYCALMRKPFVVADAYGDLSTIDERLQFDRSWDEMNDFRTRDVICAPAVFKDEVMGVIQVINSKDHPFCTEDLIPLQSISRLVGYALYHARLHDELSTLKALEKQKAEFMRVLVHELKSPVAASKSLAAALQYASQDNPKVSSILGRMEKRMDELLNLVADILSLSQIKSGKPLGQVVVCDLVEKTQSGCTSHLETAETKGLNTTLDLPPSPVPVRIDEQAYQLILSNLVSNAVKYTSAGSINVHLSQHAPWAVLEISDTGMGIPASDIPKLFQEFFRATNARRSQIEGSGVGLAGVKELVERFGGELELESQENQGSTFTVKLPLFQE